MATFVVIARYRSCGSPAETRQLYQEVHQYFAKWSPPEGAKRLDLYLGIDQRTIVGIWEATHEALALVTAQYTAWLEIEVIPVGSPEVVIGSLVKGGLISARGS